MARLSTTMRSGASRSLLRLCRPVLAGWLSVLTILFCAILPMGLPQTAAHGSAFNPATTSVVVLTRTPQRRLAILPRTGPDLDAHKHIPVREIPRFLSALPDLVPTRFARAAGAMWNTDFAFQQLALAGIRFARGPPQA
jgi:hypothetical protein